MISQLLASLCWDYPLILHVAFVSYQDHLSVIPRVRLNLSTPRQSERRWKGCTHKQSLKKWVPFKWLLSPDTERWVPFNNESFFLVLITKHIKWKTLYSQHSPFRSVDHKNKFNKWASALWNFIKEFILLLLKTSNQHCSSVISLYCPFSLKIIKKSEK